MASSCYSCFPVLVSLIPKQKVKTPSVFISNILYVNNRPEGGNAQRSVRLMTAVATDRPTPEVMTQNVDDRCHWSDVAILDDCDNVVVHELSVKRVPVDPGGQCGHEHVEQHCTKSRRRAVKRRYRRVSMRLRSAGHRKSPTLNVENFTLVAAFRHRRLTAPQRHQCVQHVRLVANTLLPNVAELKKRRMLIYIGETMNWIFCYII